MGAAMFRCAPAPPWKIRALPDAGGASSVISPIETHCFRRMLRYSGSD